MLTCPKIKSLARLSTIAHPRTRSSSSPRQADDDVQYSVVSGVNSCCVDSLWHNKVYHQHCLAHTSGCAGIDAGYPALWLVSTMGGEVCKFADIQDQGVWLLPESPRWLISKDRETEGLNILAKVGSLDSKHSLKTDVN